ncbi:putative F-box/LRR-repeat protein At5g02930 [Actinidia eriantha]|uniref:putative F-box/LRR-repeat protein At5g02930 n=1 Tax=Actinidia eriantha TaxID=165200 RepID=UPI0025882308|nr:putative F-box/LRR-repeat protein At5g02930 [Actinidia eriantha]
MEVTKKKRQKTKKNAKNLEEKRDYFTELSEPLLHKILSYLEMKDVIRTSVLAKRPKYKEVAFINRTLLLYKGPKIQKLNITFTYSKADAHHIDSWIHFASAHNVNEISLDLHFNRLWPDNPSLDFYKVPHFIFSSTSLTVLTLVKCVIVFPINYKLSSLKILSLKDVYFSSGAIKDLISSSPILEFLSLTYCERFRDLQLFIFQKGLKTLKIHEDDFLSSSSILSVSAPYVNSFELVTSLHRKYYFIHDIQSLHSATFACNKWHCTYKGENEDFIFKIFDAVQHVKDLQFCSCYIEALFHRHREDQSAGCPSFDLTCPRLKTQLTSKMLSGTVYMLRHSPNIETLIISINKIVYKELDENVEGGEHWRVQEPEFVHLLCNLKTVKIYNFTNNLIAVPDTTSEELLEQLQIGMNFLRFLLKNSRALERMIITTGSDIFFGDQSKSKKLKLMLQVSRELLAFPRASPNAEISFS